MVNIKAKIISNTPVAREHSRLVLEVPEMVKESQPGQFMHIRVHEGLNPLLRRPFSIHRIVHPNTRAPVYQVEILYKIRGRGTELLAKRKKGEFLDVIGPLGKGFPLPLEADTSVPRTYLLVAGGIGIAPLLFLAEKLAEFKIQNSKLKIIAFVGLKTKNYLLCEKELRSLCDEVKISTEDGSLGFKGLVSDLLKDFLLTVDSEPFTLYSAGPILMLQEIKKIANMFKILCFGSLEENIACGLGGCFGCVVKTTEGYKRVCKEGPVFNLEEIIWE
ncbi:MAG: dihydroorotate dehydrogenase electron transfer subunit [Candidatus Omnitrophica bacterium]|nr:dihydroorotate dehydrogenase electron transfer subunit [Candidatus Omnitrophota bacterium]